jgi:hypothetical protein
MPLAVILVAAAAGRLHRRRHTIADVTIGAQSMPAAYALARLRVPD